MFLREEPTLTLHDVQDDIESRKVQAADLQAQEVVFDADELSITLPTPNGTEVPFTVPGLKAFGDMVDVPGKFIERIDPELQAHVLTHLLRRNPGVVRVVYNDDGVIEVRDPEIKTIDPRAIVQIAMKILTPEAPVMDFASNKDEFRLDATVPQDFDRGIGGEPEVNDITLGGIRFYQDRKHNLAPSVSEYLYRLACTNGMEIVDELLKVDARGASVEEVLLNLDQAADRAFRRVEDTIASFYEMKGTEVENPERDIIRIAEEQGISSRTAYAMAERAPGISENPTMFDLVNLVTNQANDPALINKPRQRHRLERVGGNLVNEHTERCSHCRARLNLN